MALSRRDFLSRVGQAGGYSATFATMQALGLMPMKGAHAEPIQATADTGKGVKVVVLGAGIGGLVSAYELRKYGYDVTLLEARERPGGRNWSGRKGTVIEFIDGTKQTIDWEEGNYQNLGPALARRSRSSKSRRTCTRCSTRASGTACCTRRHGTGRRP
jgi:monoamine oxidase